jgi:hypothetical protein
MSTRLSEPELLAREELLLIWLDPNAEGSEAGRFARRPVAELARALAMRLGTATLSDRMLLRVIREVQAKHPERVLLLLSRGRPPRAQQQPVKGPHMPRTADERRLWAGLCRELLVLTGWSAKQLHACLAQRPEWQARLGSRASFHRLLHELAGPVPQDDGVRRPDDDGIDHTLHVHQVVTRGPQGTWRVVLLAWDVQTTYLNAVIFEVLPPSALGPGPAARRGRPPTNYQRDRHAQLVEVQGQVQVRLPAELILDFVEDTRAKMGVPVGVLHLASSLGDTQSLAAWLLEREPQGSFVALPSRLAQLEREAGQELSTDEFRRRLASALNQHNGHVAHSALRLKRQQLQSYRDAVTLLPEDTEDPLWARASPALRRKVRLGRMLVDYERISPIAPHRGTHLSCRPVWLLGLWEPAPLPPVSPAESGETGHCHSVLPGTTGQ